MEERAWIKLSQSVTCGSDADNEDNEEDWETQSEHESAGKNTTDPTKIDPLQAINANTNSNTTNLHSHDPDLAKENISQPTGNQDIAKLKADINEILSIDTETDAQTECDDDEMSAESNEDTREIKKETPKQKCSKKHARRSAQKKEINKRKASTPETIPVSKHKKEKQQQTKTSHWWITLWREIQSHLNYDHPHFGGT